MRWPTDISTYFLAHCSTGKTFCYWYWSGRFLTCPTCWHPSEWGQKACSWGKLLGKTNYSEIRNLFRNPWCGRSSPMSVCDHFLARKAFQFHSPLVSHSSHNCQRHSSAPCSCSEKGTRVAWRLGFVKTKRKGDSRMPRCSPFRKKLKKSGHNQRGLNYARWTSKTCGITWPHSRGQGQGLE